MYPHETDSLVAPSIHRHEKDHIPTINQNPAAFHCMHLAPDAGRQKHTRGAANIRAGWGIAPSL